MNIAVAILGLALLVLVHEAGHFFVARAVGMRPRRFYVGFPPPLARVRRGGIEYGIGAIPLGGYVKIPGMHRPAPTDVDVHFGRAVSEAPELTGPLERLKRSLAGGELDRARGDVKTVAEAVGDLPLSAPAARGAERGVRELQDGLGPDAYWRQQTWRKLAVIVAGPAANLVVAVVLLAAVFMAGIPVSATRTVEAVVPGSPAEAIGLRPGDQIVGLAERPVDPSRIPETIRASRGEPITVTVRRDGMLQILGPVRPMRDERGYRLGFVLAPRYQSYGVAESLRLAGRETWAVTKAIGVSLVEIVTGENREAVSTPVGVVQGSSQALEVGVRYYLQVLALISLSLALLNLLPLLPLDGGHVAFSIIEGLRGRAVGRGTYERASAIGIAFVLFLFAIGLSNDIGRLSGG